MRGFTIVELMVVLVIIGILASIAYPAYIDNVRKAQRQDAIIGLTETSQRLERCYTEYNSYNNDNCPVNFPITTAEGRYTITANLAASSFAMTATPTDGGGMQADDDCTTFTLAHTGARGATGENPDRCW
jgi:type IV pilus assembly protein PilE